MKHLQYQKSITSNTSRRIKSSYNTRNKSYTNNQSFTNNILSPIKTIKKPLSKINIKNFASFIDSTTETTTKIKREKSSFSFQTNINNIKNKKNFSYIYSSQNKNRRPVSSINKISIEKNRWRFSDEPVWKKFLRGKLLFLLKKNIILNEKKFNPLSFTESISNIKVKNFKNKFKNMDNRTKVGIFTNKYPEILNQKNKFYSRYFDHFISPNELLFKNFTKEEIFQIKSDPIFFNLGGDFTNVNFFKKKSLKDTLNEEEKIGASNIIDVEMKKSLKQTKKRIQKYMDYYTSVMSRQGLLGH